MLTLNLLELFFNSIEYIHGSVWPDCNEIFNSADYTLADFRHGGFLLIGHAAYDEIYLPAFLEIVSYADSDSRVVLCSEEFLNILKAVVSSVAAFLILRVPKGRFRSSQITRMFSTGMFSLFIQ